MKSSQKAGRGRGGQRHEPAGTKGSPQIRAHKGRPFYEARRRDLFSEESRSTIALVL